MPEQRFKCPNCGSTSFHFRTRAQEYVCHKCPTITPYGRGGGQPKTNKVREAILSVMRAAEKGMPVGVGAWSISYKKANAACRYMGPVDEEICKLMDEGLVTEWSPYGTIYYIGDHPLVCPPWREKEIAEALKEGKDIRVTKESMERDEKERESADNPENPT